MNIEVNLIDKLYIVPMMLEEMQLYHWIKNKITREGFSREKLAKLFGISALSLDGWGNGQYPYFKCEMIALVTGISEYELAIEKYAFNKKSCFDKKEKFILKVDDLIINKINHNGTQFINWYKRGDFIQTKLAKQTKVAVHTWNKWVNRTFGYNDIFLISTITRINEAILLIELIGLKKYLKQKG